MAMYIYMCVCAYIYTHIQAITVLFLLCMRLSECVIDVCVQMMCVYLYR